MRLVQGVIMLACVVALAGCGEDTAPTPTEPATTSDASAGASFDWSGVAAAEKETAVASYWPLAARLDELGDRLQASDTLRYAQSGGVQVVSCGEIISHVTGEDGARIVLDAALWKAMVESVRAAQGDVAIRAVPGEPGTVAPRRAYVLRSAPGTYELSVEIVKSLD